MRDPKVKALVVSSFFGGIVLALLAPGGAAGVFSPPVHTTDGMFTNASEWDATRATVTEVHFPVVGNTGGANLFVEQSSGVLYLMYDYTNSNALGLSPGNAAFNVFFQVPNDNTQGGEDYVVHFTGSTFQAFEKLTSGPASPLNPDGSFDLNSPVWTPLSTDDLARAGFQTAIGFGHDPATPAVPDHLLAEFQLNLQSASNPGGGFYDPAPAFWSASVSGTGGPAADPPISSGIFELNPDGTTIVIPVFGANGGPALQPQDVTVPEPASVTLTGLGVALLVAGRRRMARRREPVEG